MKISPLFVCGLLLSLACQKEEKCTEMTVIRNCTGTYLHISGKAYQVCNPEKVNSFAGNATVCALVQRINECNGSAQEAVTCKMAYPNEGWIEVKYIR